MHTIRTRNAQSALWEGIRHLKGYGLSMPSRAGSVIVAPGPVTTTYNRPLERVIFYPERDANPFFHFAEALWILAGRNDAAFLTQFVKRMAEFSDDGETFHGAYGYRLRDYFALQNGVTSGEGHYSDQINTAVQMLKDDMFSRRVVLQLWDAEADLNRNGVDLPCNTHAYLSVSYGERDRPNKLNITVCNRSNDIIWGAYGANVVQFSTLLEYIAARLGLDVGYYHQVSNNYHAYYDIYEPLARSITMMDDPYSYVKPYPLVRDADSFDDELQVFMSAPLNVERSYRNPYFSRVATPLFTAHTYYKEKHYAAALAQAMKIAATDWRKAAHEWLQRRIAKL